MSDHIPNGSSPIIAVGNPPFGYRAWLALAFMNKTAEYADYAAFILPMSFISEGKGSPKYRVKGMRLVESVELPKDSFARPDGEAVSLSTVFQLWEKGENTKPDFSGLEKRFHIGVVQNTKGRTCGQELIDTADIFIPQSFYGPDDAKPTFSYSKVNYPTAYAVTAKEQSEKGWLVMAVMTADWFADYSSPATSGCRHTNKFFIYKRLQDVMEREGKSVAAVPAAETQSFSE